MEYFNTDDIVLATYLVLRSVPLVEIAPINEKFSRFIFQDPPPSVLREFLSGNTYERKIVDAYRHLVRDAYLAQQKLEGGK